MSERLQALSRRAFVPRVLVDLYRAPMRRRRIRLVWVGRKLKSVRERRDRLRRSWFRLL